MKALIISLLMLPLMAFAGNTDEVKTIVLEESNTISLRDAVNWNSMSILQADLLKKSIKLGPDEPIYLVLDTPGGSVSAGNMFIETLKGIPNPVHTVVIFAASMGFQITQATEKRYILESGILMSHRATVGLQGQLNGELESRLVFYKTMVDTMEEKVAKRVGMDFLAYKDRIVNEWWEVGYNAVTSKVADEVVIVKCSKTLLRGSIFKRLFSIFGGARKVEFSKCPLIVAPLSVSAANTFDEKTEDITYFNTLFSNKKSFFENYVKTGLFNR
jgi:ATP-dependent protease ClpP protease subunit